MYKCYLLLFIGLLVAPFANGKEHLNGTLPIAPDDLEMMQNIDYDFFCHQQTLEQIFVFCSDKTLPDETSPQRKRHKKLRKSLRQKVLEHQGDNPIILQ